MKSSASMRYSVFMKHWGRWIFGLLVFFLVQQHTYANDNDVLPIERAEDLILHDFVNDEQEIAKAAIQLKIDLDEQNNDAYHLHVQAKLTIIPYDQRLVRISTADMVCTFDGYLDLQHTDVLEIVQGEEQTTGMDYVQWSYQCPDKFSIDVGHRHYFEMDQTGRMLREKSFVLSLSTLEHQPYAYEPALNILSILKVENQD